MVRRPMALAASAAMLFASFAVVPPAGASDAIAVGDSITVGAQPQISAAGYSVDAVVGRTFAQGLGVVRAQGASLPPRVLVNLGTNGGVTVAQCQELVSLVGPDRALTLVTINLPAYPEVAARSNAALAQCAGADNVALVDWAGHTQSHPGLLCPDGIHISCGGGAAYARFVLPQVLPAPGESSAQPAVDPGPASPAAGSQAAAAPAAGTDRSSAVRASGPSAALAAAQAELAAAQAELAAAQQLAELRAQQEQAAAEAARAAAEQLRRLQRLQRLGVQDLQVVERRTSPNSYRFVPVVDRLLSASASS